MLSHITVVQMTRVLFWYIWHFDRNVGLATNPSRSYFVFLRKVSFRVYALIVDTSSLSSRLSFLSADTGVKVYSRPPLPCFRSMPADKRVSVTNCWGEMQSIRKWTGSTTQSWFFAKPCIFLTFGQLQKQIGFNKAEKFLSQVNAGQWTGYQEAQSFVVVVNLVHSLHSHLSHIR